MRRTGRLQACLEIFSQNSHFGYIVVLTIQQYFILQYSFNHEPCFFIGADRRCMLGKNAEAYLVETQFPEGVAKQ